MAVLMERIPDLGLRGTRALMEPGHNCVVEEKIDGAQMTFGVSDGQLAAYSRRHALHLGRIPLRFRNVMAALGAVASVMEPGLSYRAEVVNRPQSVTLAYDRVAANFAVLFDVTRADGSFLDAEARARWAEKLGLDCVPVLHQGEVTPALLTDLIANSVPLLGGERIEGVVVKSADDLSAERMMGKFVADDFKEAHIVDWSGSTDPRSMVQSLAFSVATPARFNKMVQAMAEDGVLTGTRADIGEFCRRTIANVAEEQGEELLEQWNRYWESRPKANHTGAARMTKDLNRQVNDTAAIWFRTELEAGRIAPVQGEDT